jgi:hypothetical protein
VWEFCFPNGTRFPTLLRLPGWVAGSGEQYLPGTGSPAPHNVQRWVRSTSRGVDEVGKGTIDPSPRLFRPSSALTSEQLEHTSLRFFGRKRWGVTASRVERALSWSVRGCGRGERVAEGGKRGRMIERFKGGLDGCRASPCCSAAELDPHRPQRAIHSPPFTFRLTRRMGKGPDSSQTSSGPRGRAGASAGEGGSAAFSALIK